MITATATTQRVATLVGRGLSTSLYGVINRRPLLFPSSSPSLPLFLGSSKATFSSFAKDSDNSSSNNDTNNDKPRSKSSRWTKLLLVSVLMAVPINLFLYYRTRESSISSSELEALKRLPLRGISRVWGWIHNQELPLWLRLKLFNWWATTYGCDLTEMRDPIESYKTLNAFFTRKLREGVRPIEDGAIVSPVDGKVLVFGTVDQLQKMEQIKGVTYSLESFVGNPMPDGLSTAIDGKQRNSNELFYCVTYLSPGDYHGIHSGTDWTIKSYRHFPGHLFPVAPWLVNILQGLFALNERIVLSGEWKYGYFSLSPVGATNVGSIVLSLPPNATTSVICTNVPSLPPSSPFVEGFFNPSTNQLSQRKGDIKERETTGISIAKGEEVAFFHFGSTVVLVFEAPKTGRFTVTEGQKIKLGQTMFTIDAPPRS